MKHLFVIFLLAISINSNAQSKKEKFPKTDSASYKKNSDSLLVIKKFSLTLSEEEWVAIMNLMRHNSLLKASVTEDLIEELSKKLKAN